MDTTKIWSAVYAKGTSTASLLSAIVEEIRTDYVDFTNSLEDAGHLDFYKDCSAIVRRMMFFDYIGDTTRPLRKIVKQWLLIDGSGAREDELNAFYHDLGYWHMEHCIESMNNMRNELRRANPILVDKSIPLGLREGFLKGVLKNNNRYQIAMKELDKKIKDVIAKIVSVEINEINPSTLSTEWRDLYM